MIINFNNGTQISEGRRAHWAYAGAPEDISTSASYTTKVDEEQNVLIVRRGVANLGSDNRRDDGGQ